MSHRLRIILGSLFLVLFLALVGIWFYAPYYAVRYINKAFKGLPGYTGNVEWVRFHPITASLDVYNFHIDKNGVPVHYFYSPRWHVALQWSEILHGVFRTSVSIFDPQVNLVAAPEKSDSQIGISGIWIDVIKQLIPFRVNEIHIHHGNIHFLDFHADPKVDLAIDNLELNALNMSNADRKKDPLPAKIKITANPLKTGYFQMDMAINFDERYATFSQTFKMEHVPAVGANSALQKFAKVQVTRGEIGLYSELTGDKGVYHGYVKPFFHDLEFAPNPKDKGTPGAIWSGVVNTVKGVFENDQKTIATEAPISGRVDQPEVDTLSVIGGVLWNAWIESLRSGFDPTKSPPKPTDTVTTPKSTETKEEAKEPSPAEKK